MSGRNTGVFTSGTRRKALQGCKIGALAREKNGCIGFGGNSAGSSAVGGSQWVLGFLEAPGFVFWFRSHLSCMQSCCLAAMPSPKLVQLALRKKLTHRALRCALRHVKLHSHEYLTFEAPDCPSFSFSRDNFRSAIAETFHSKFATALPVWEGRQPVVLQSRVCSIQSKRLGNRTVPGIELGC